MGEMMKGLVSHADGKFELMEVPKPRMGENPYAPHDVVCEVQYCGICGSDIHNWKGDKKGVHTSPYNAVAGHEIVSIVREVGPEVTLVKPGDRVVHEIVTNYCGHCKACEEGRYNICNAISSMEGRAHFTTGGGFARWTVWPEWQLHILPDTIKTKEAVLMEPLAGSIHSVITRMNVKAGETVAILGSGARGILMMQVCKAIGAGMVIMTGLTRDVPHRLKKAKELGADYVVNVEEENIRDVVNRLTDGRGVDVVLENSGSVEPIEESLDIVRKGGRILWAGGGIRGGIVAPVDTHKIIVKELDVRGEISQTPYDWRTAVQLAGEGKVKLEPLVTNYYSLEEWHEAFELAATSTDPLRVAIKLSDN